MMDASSLEGPSSVAHGVITRAKEDQQRCGVMRKIQSDA